MKTTKQNIINAYNKAECKETKDTLKRLYPDITFERLLPKSWEEFCEIIGIIGKNTFGYDSQTNFDSHTLKKDYTKFWGPLQIVPKKYVALRKLELLRDYYNDGWKPDWGKSNYKYCITLNDGFIDTNENISIVRFLSFETCKLRSEFLENFKDLIEQAEDLI
jgi:hypothetical protein